MVISDTAKKLCSVISCCYAQQIIDCSSWAAECKTSLSSYYLHSQQLDTCSECRLTVNDLIFAGRQISCSNSTVDILAYNDSDLEYLT